MELAWTKSGSGDACNPAAAAGRRGGLWTGNADGGALHPARRLTGNRAEGPTPVEKVWGRLGLQQMPSPASTEHSGMWVREAPSPWEGGSELDEDEPHLPIQPRNLFGAHNEDAASDDTGSTDSGQNSNDAAPGVEVEISAEGYADDTYMLAIHLLSLLTMLVATSNWLKLTGQEVNAKKSLPFLATIKVRRKPETPGGDPRRSADASTAGVLAAGSRSSHDAAKGHRPTALAPHWGSQKGVEESPNHSRGLRS